MNEKEFRKSLEQAQKQLIAARHIKINIETDLPTLFVMIANLQLALRYPNNTGQSAAEVHTMAVNLIELIREDLPEVASLLDLGWDSQHDRPLDKDQNEQE